MPVNLSMKLSKDIEVMEYKSFTDLDLKLFKNQFTELRKKGIITNDNFEDNKWHMTSIVARRSISFNIDETTYVREKKSRSYDFEFIDVINAVKCFVLIKFDYYSLPSIALIGRKIIKFLNMTHLFSEKKVKDLESYFRKNINNADCAYFIAEFIEFFPISPVKKEYLNILLEYDDIYVESRDRGKIRNREIPNLESVFKLSDIIEDVFKKMDNQLKEMYYPVYLWWKITTIIPLRITEFLITPKECIYTEDNNYYLIVRRSNLKSEKKVKKTHSLGDYFLQSIQINKEIYDIISEYIEIVKDSDYIVSSENNKKIPVGRQFLISYRSYLNVKGEGNRVSFKEFEYLERPLFTKILKRFFKEIVSPLGYTIVKKGKSKNTILDDYQIEEIQPMDTRHLATINLIMQGYTPIIIKELSGHKDIESSYNYYNHLPQYVRCWIYSIANRKIRENIQDKNLDNIKYSVRNLSNVDIKYQRVFKKDMLEKSVECNGGSGKCSSKDINDCIKVNGECSLGCEFFFPNNNDVVYESLEAIDRKIESIVKTLKILIKNNKTELNFEEQYGTYINKLHLCLSQGATILADNNSYDI